MATTTARGLCPFAKHLLIEPGSNDPPIIPRTAILHVDAGGARTLFSYFKFRSGGIESHFHIRWTGAIEQYRNIYWEADANYRANAFAVSIETQGFGGGKWTKRQLRSIKRLLLWLEGEGIPLVVPETWDSPGVGYHIQFGSPGYWTNVAKACPGAERIKQYRSNLVPWMESNPGVEKDWLTMATEAEVRKIVREEAALAVNAILDEKQANGYSLRRNIRMGGNSKEIAEAILAIVRGGELK